MARIAFSTIFSASPAGGAEAGPDYFYSRTPVSGCATACGVVPRLFRVLLGVAISWPSSRQPGCMLRPICMATVGSTDRRR
jgi:hypothetical protein